LVKEPRRIQAMKDRLTRVLATISAVAAMALAGGASLKGF
jgi:hypothetical protein